MTQAELYKKLKNAFLKIVKENGLMAQRVEILSKALTPQEAIGITKRRDFPILTGKEVMLQAQCGDACGQAFTDSPAVFKGTLAEICAMDFEKDPYATGLFIASLNAVMKHLGKSDCTVHCKTDGPEQCARDARSYVKEHYGDVRITLIGYQPALLESLAGVFEVRVLDLNPANIGAVRYGVKVEDGTAAYESAVEWAELILCTGSTVCNGTIVRFIGLDKPVLFFGTTLSGAAPILGLQRLCFADRYR